VTSRFLEPGHHVPREGARFLGFLVVTDGLGHRATPWPPARERYVPARLYGILAHGCRRIRLQTGATGAPLASARAVARATAGYSRLLVCHPTFLRNSFIRR
jgi:hypothetical protein